MKCRRVVYTTHREVYEFEINKETLKDITNYANSPYLVDKTGTKLEPVTAQEVIDIVTCKICPSDRSSREARIADAINDYLWDCEYEDEYCQVDDSIPWEDSIIYEPY